MIGFGRPRHHGSYMGGHGCVRGEQVVQATFQSLDREGDGQITFAGFQAGLFQQDATSPLKDVDHYANMGARVAAQKARFAEAQAMVHTAEELATALRQKLNSAVQGLAASFKHFLVKVGCLVGWFVCLVD